VGEGGRGSEVLSSVRRGWESSPSSPQEFLGRSCGVALTKSAVVKCRRLVVGGVRRRLSFFL
jgi:hypothetical protein